MIKHAISTAVAAAVIGLGGVAGPGSAWADGIFDMMNPARWFGSSDRGYRDDWYYRRGPYGWGGPYAWGGPYGYGWGGPWGHPGANRTVVVVASDTSDTSQDIYPE